jgi:hypothetical protein
MVARREQMRQMALFMAWKQSAGFVLATEVIEPTRSMRSA